MQHREKSTIDLYVFLIEFLYDNFIFNFNRKLIFIDYLYC